jgi:hypothetical protein
MMGRVHNQETVLIEGSQSVFGLLIAKFNYLKVFATDIHNTYLTIPREQKTYAFRGAVSGLQKRESIPLQ